MDAFNYRIKSYQEVPDISDNQIKVLTQLRKIVFFHNLVIDFTDFRHPGYNSTIEEFQNRQISTVFHSSSHSFNAQMLVCRLTVGKLNNSQHEKDGKIFYERIRKQTKNVKYQAALDKIDFSKSLLKEIQKLSAEQLNLLVQTPTIFKNPDNIHFLEGKYQNFNYQQHFWITFATLSIYFIIIVNWLLSTFQMAQIVQNIGFFAFGIVKWTILQYYFHRFIYHYKLLSFEGVRGHLLHHMFPNINRKVAISIIGITIRLILIAIVYLYFLQPLLIGLIYAGFIGTIITYDCLHYYCHFGPQINLKLLKYLRISHLKHHYRDPSRYFGVTNTFWDLILGTGINNIEQRKAKE